MVKSSFTLKSHRRQAGTLSWWTDTISQVEADHRDMDTSATTKSHPRTTDEYKNL
jgi:hypothetical protein